MKKLILFLMVISLGSVKAQDTVKMKDLQKTGGMYYLKDIPYSGYAATYYPNGAIASLYNIFNGVKSGKVQVYYDSGKLRVITYEDKNSENYGETKVWNEDGSVAFEGNWINGKLYKNNETTPFSGEIKVYYTNGRINEQSQFSNGMWNGTQTRWERDGKVLSECIFRDNKIVDCKQ